MKARDTGPSRVRPRATFLLALTFLAASLPAAAEEHRLRGRLGEIDGLRILELVGSAEQQGFTEGYLLADGIVELIEGFALSKKVVPMPKLWDMLLRPAVDRRVTVPDALRERYRGVLAGLKSRLGTLRIEALDRPLALGDLVTAATIPDLQGLLCSSYAAWGESTGTDGTLVVGRNLDYFATGTLTEQTLVIVNVPSPPRIGWVSIGWPGVGGCLTGISEAGLFVAIHDVRAWGREAERFTPRVLALQELIEQIDPRKADDVAAEARDLLRQYRFGMGGNVLVAWEQSRRGPGACVLELDGRSSAEDGVSLRRPQGESFIACTNHFREREDERHCRRYRALWEGLLETKENPLTPQSSWDLICRPTKHNTIYRLTCFLEGGEVRLERRLEPRSKKFHGTRFNYRELLRRAAAIEARAVVK